MNSTTPYIYDQLPYPNLSFTQTHPDRLATLATLLGMEPPCIEHCRMLELGCAQGGNLIPIAYELPGSEFVGIDLSARQIQQGQARLEQLSLENISLEQCNILDIDGSLGKFDYIVTHGVYSWVPPNVQDKILEICSQHLNPNGVAYVSYNTYPGWHLIGAIREMMLYHTRNLDDAQQRATEARNFVDFLAQSVANDQNTPHGSFFNAYINFYKNEIRHLNLENQALLAHDELAEINEPVYFYQFIEHAERHGLKYLADANFQAMLASNLPADIASELRHMVSSTVELEQYMDFLRNRTFRQTLLCHQSVRLSGSPKPELITRFCIGSPAVPVSPPNPYDDSIAKFHVGSATLSTDHPLTKAALIYLTKTWPHIARFEELLSRAREILNTKEEPTEISERDVNVLGATLFKGYGFDDSLVELHTYIPQFTSRVSARPIASPVSRLQAKHGDIITNIRHERVKLGPLSYHLLPYLDGSRDHEALKQLLQKLVLQGIMPVQPKDEDEANAGTDTSSPDEIIKNQLRHLANAALLVG